MEDSTWREDEAAAGRKHTNDNLTFKETLNV